ncbi:unnamed protein product [Rotaria socialis]|uniref:Polysaccharide lyase family 8 central domain-containing protein n=1 Tax=Rotaria socialis TaxID=392032 RepID=A0A821GRD2_9BILA|nr:unnamed protein product [Rotaria socialis]
MVSIPRLVTGQLLMLGDNTTNFEVQKITEISFRSDWWEHNPGTGANLVWMLQIELYRSLATNNRTGIEQGFTRMWQDIVVSPLGGQGIQNDWSYHFQRTQLLSGDAWMITNDRWDWQSIGRAIDRPGTSLHVVFEVNWIRLLAEFVNATDYREIFPLLDWKSINGITVNQDISIEPCKSGDFNWIKLEFVGGVSDSSYGLAMMDTATHNLTVKRSWHFYDDAVMALASNLTVSTQNKAWTPLASRLLTTALGVEISTKTASYNTIGPYNDKLTSRTVAIWLDHGLGPYTRNYSYIILSNVKVQSMPELIKRYNDDEIFSCISNQDLFHAMAWLTLRRVSFVLRNNTTTMFSSQNSFFKINARLNDAGAYLFNEATNDLSATVSHPTRINRIVTINIDRIGYGQGCIVLSDLTTNVMIALPSSDPLLGASVTVTCKKKQLKLHYKY